MADNWPCFTLVCLNCQVLQENPALLELPDPVTDKVKITEELLAQVSCIFRSKLTVHLYIVCILKDNSGEKKN